MVQLPELLRDFAENRDSWHPWQIEMFLKTFDEVKGTHAGALLNGIPGLYDNPFISSSEEKAKLIATIRAKAGVSV